MVILFAYLYSQSKESVLKIGTMEGKGERKKGRTGCKKECKTGVKQKVMNERKTVF
jgi:hypothetical protein